MPNLVVTTVQANLIWEDKTANLKHLAEKISAITEPTHIVVLPEMFSTGFSMQPEKLAEKMDGPTVAWMKEIAARKKIILTGSFICEENGQYTNRLVWMLPTGEMATYDKKHRFAFAGEDQHYSAGNKRLIAQVNGWKINLLICYDLRFPVFARNKVITQTDGTQQPEYDVLIYVANWPARRSYQWQQLAIARAIENQSYLIAVNRVGNDGKDIPHNGSTMVVDPLGEVLYKKLDEEETATHTLSQEYLQQIRTQFPFWKDADSFTLL